MAATEHNHKPRPTDRSAVSQVIQTLFGTESSTRAFDRQRMSFNEIARTHADETGDRLTYGEFDLDFFFELVTLAKPVPGETFCDLGSGCGRLVLAAALDGTEWNCAIGIELLQNLHNLARDTKETLEPLAASADDLSLRPCKFHCGDAAELLPRLCASGSDSKWVMFSYTTCMPSVGPYLCELSETLGLTLPVGSRVITTDKMLINDDDGRWVFRELARVERPNYNTLTSTGFVFELIGRDMPDAERIQGAVTTPRQITREMNRRAVSLAAVSAAVLAPLRSQMARGPHVVWAATTPYTEAESASTPMPLSYTFRSRSLGMALTDSAGPGTGVTVSRTLPGSEAEALGLAKGLTITAVNGERMGDSVTAAQLGKLLQEAKRPVKLTFEMRGQDLMAPAVRDDNASAQERRRDQVAEEEPQQELRIEALTAPGACGVRAQRGDLVEVHYTASVKGETNTLQFDSSFERGTGAPFALQLGNGDVPKALELGLFDMCLGERRRITSPPRLAFGTSGNRVLGVPPNSVVVWEVSMEAINFVSARTSRIDAARMAERMDLED